MTLPTFASDRRSQWLAGCALALSFMVAGCQDGPYAPPPGEFACGDTYCEISTQFCVTTTADAGTATGTCGSLLDACGSATPACGCVESECSNPGMCSQGSDGSITLTCSN